MPPPNINARMMRDLNRVLRQVSEQQAQINEQLGSQVDMYRQMHEILVRIQTETLPDIAEGLEDAADSMGDLGTQGGILSGVIGGLGKAFEFVFGIVGTLGKAAWGILKGVGSTLIGIGKFVGKTLVGVFKTAFQVAGAAIGGFMTVWLYPLQKGFEVLYSVVKSILGEFKLLGGVIPDFGRLAEEMAQYRRQAAIAAESIRGSFGDIGKGSGEMGSKVMRAVRNAGNSFGRFGPNAGQMAQEVGKIFADFGVTAFGRLGNEIARNSKLMFRFVKGSGVSGEALKNLGTYALFTGQTLTKLVRVTTTLSAKFGRLTGGTYMFRKQFAEARGDIRAFGNVSDRALGAAIAHVNSLGLSMRDLKGMMTAFDDFPKAAENVSMLNQQLGMNLDVIGLVREQDPAKRFDMIRKEFLRQGNSFADLTRQQKDLLSRTLDTPVEILAAGFREGGAGLDELRRRVRHEKPMERMARTLSRLAASIERLFVTKVPGGGLFGSFFDGIAESVKYSSATTKMAAAMERSQRAGMAFGRNMMGADKPVGRMFNWLLNLFDGGRFSRALTMGLEAIESFINDPTRGLKSLFLELWGAFEHFLGPNGARMIGKMLKGVAVWWQEIGVSIVRFLVEGVTKALSTLAAILIDPDAFLKEVDAKASQLRNVGGGIIDEVSAPWRRLAADRQLWGGLMNAFSKFATALKKRVIEPMGKWFEEKFKEIHKVMLDTLNDMFGTRSDSIGGAFKQGFAKLENKVNEWLQPMLAKMKLWAGRAALIVGAYFIAKFAVKMGSMAMTNAVGSAMSGAMGKAGLILLIAAGLADALTSAVSGNRMLLAKAGDAIGNMVWEAFNETMETKAQKASQWVQNMQETYASIFKDTGINEAEDQFREAFDGAAEQLAKVNQLMSSAGVETLKTNAAFAGFLERRREMFTIKSLMSQHAQGKTATWQMPEHVRDASKDFNLGTLFSQGPEAMAERLRVLTRNFQTDISEGNLSLQASPQQLAIIRASGNTLVNSLIDQSLSATRIKDLAEEALQGAVRLENTQSYFTGAMAPLKGDPVLAGFVENYGELYDEYQRTGKQRIAELTSERNLAQDLAHRARQAWGGDDANVHALREHEMYRMVAVRLGAQRRGMVKRFQTVTSQEFTDNLENLHRHMRGLLSSAPAPETPAVSPAIAEAQQLLREAPQTLLERAGAVMETVEKFLAFKPQIDAFVSQFQGDNLFETATLDMATMLNQGFRNLSTINVPALAETDLILQTVSRLVDNILTLTGRRVRSALVAAGRIGKVIERVHGSLSNLDLGKQIVQLRGVEGKLWGEGAGVHKVQIGVPKIDITLSVIVQLDAADVVGAIFNGGAASAGLMSGIVSYVGQGDTIDGMSPNNQLVTADPGASSRRSFRGGAVQGGDVFGASMAPNTTGQPGPDLRTAIGLR